MKRSWLWAWLLAGSLVAALSAPALADENNGADAKDAMEDVNSALGSLSSRVADVEKKQGMQIEVHGFAELDAIYDNKLMGLGSETIGDNAQIPKPGTIGDTNGQTQFSPRNSRISLLAKTTIAGWATKGYLEGDFLGISNGANGAAVTTGSENTAVGGSENKLYTQPTFRIRHAYLDVQKDGWDIMAGQYWTLFGWNMDNVLATLEVSPIMGSLYERTPRIGVMKTVGGTDAMVQIALDAERPEQAFSTIPNFNGGIRFMLNSWQAQFAYATGASKLVPLSLGISGRLATYNFFSGTSAPTTTVTGQGVAVDAQIPILTATSANVNDNPTIILCGEWMVGYGVGDVLNGWNGGGASSPASGDGLDSGIAGTLTAGGATTMIDDESWAAQIQIHLPQSIGTYLTAGYGESYTDNAALMTKASYNDVSGIFVNVIQDFTPSIRAGIEGSVFQDAYLGGPTTSGPTPTDYRLQVSSWYRF